MRISGSYSNPHVCCNVSVAAKYVVGSVPSRLLRAVDENCPLLGYYTASGGNFLPTFRDNLLVPSSRLKNPRKEFRFLIADDGTDRLSRNLGKELTLLAA